MPLIPLPRPPGPLKDLPPAVLDRERRPVIDTRAQQHAVKAFAEAAQMPMVDPDAFVRQAGAVAYIGEAITKAGGVLQAAVQHEREIASENDFFDAQSDYQNAKAEVQKERDPANPSSWPAQQEAKMQAVQERILAKPGLSDASHARISAALPRWSKLSAIEVLQDSRKAANELVRGKYAASAEQAAAGGDYAGSSQIRHQAAALGLMGAHEAAAFDASIPAMVQRDLENAAAAARQQRMQTMYEEAAAGDAAQVADRVRTRPDMIAGLDDGDRAFVEGRLRTLTDRQRSAGAEAVSRLMVQRHAAGTPLSEAELDRAAQEQHLDGPAREEFLTFRREMLQRGAAGPALDRAEAAQVLAQASGYRGDEAADPRANQWSALMRRAELLAAGGSAEGARTRDVVAQILGAEHPHGARVTDESLAPGAEREFVRELAAWRDAGVFGPAQGNPGPAATAYASVHAGLWEEFSRAAKRAPDKFSDSASVRDWLAPRLAARRAGSAVAEWRQRFNPAVSPEAALARITGGEGVRV